jgi:transmembrane sensor
MRSTEKSMTYEEYINLITKRFTGEISAEETAFLKRLVNASNKNKQIYLQQKKLWLEINAPLPEKKLDTEASWTTIEAAINKSKSNAHTLAKPKEKRWYKYAIAASILIMFGFSHYFLVEKPQDIKRFITQRDERKEIVLPDSSHVRLNFNTKLSYSQNGSGQRIVNLKGEAFFDVKKDAKPFVVQTQNAKISVLGTAFALTSRWVKTQLWVKRGKVSFNNLNSVDSAVVLIKDQFSESEGKKAPTKPEAISAEDLPGWVQGKIIFNRAPMKDVAKQLEREFDINILIVSREIENQTVTGEFKNDDIEQVLSAIGVSLSFEYRLLNGSYILFITENKKGNSP